MAQLFSDGISKVLITFRLAGPLPLLLPLPPPPPLTNPHHAPSPSHHFKFGFGGYPSAFTDIAAAAATANIPTQQQQQQLQQQQQQSHNSDGDGNDDGNDGGVTSAADMTCIVCGDKSSGKHYGQFTCEGTALMSLAIIRYARLMRGVTLLLQKVH